MNKRKIRTVTVNERGQIVIPEEIRKDFGINNNSTLVIIEKEDEIVIKKEDEVLRTIDEDVFWKKLAERSLENAWSKEDEIWDDIYAKSKRK